MAKINLAQVASWLENIRVRAWLGLDLAGHSDMAVANIVDSNIFNMQVVLGSPRSLHRWRWSCCGNYSASTYRYRSASRYSFWLWHFMAATAP